MQSQGSIVVPGLNCGPRALLQSQGSIVVPATVRPEAGATNERVAYTMSLIGFWRGAGVALTRGCASHMDGRKVPVCGTSGWPEWGRGAGRAAAEGWADRLARELQEEAAAAGERARECEERASSRARALQQEIAAADEAAAAARVPSRTGPLRAPPPAPHTERPLEQTAGSIHHCRSRAVR